ncbi:hypothetical protein [Haliangium ochraceum]|uniref:Outer membrane protein beta-barrel domain-containing protein n=1 Tax=Haliangium ochraceum (strain DSM 14365 / JCM 11303 / SMP-2) TaxID=502025 RepID=D0LG02_HALO1|nr:hypothetical protein [Haliangium ochraceum]ACY14604.1 hypothetical protein Hoch_2059 [Haliangium ochraceum DSM 14365]
MSGTLTRGRWLGPGFGIVLGALLALAELSAAHAQSAAPSAPAAAEADGEADSDADAERILGARLGVAMGRKFTPGGMRIEGQMLQRLTELDWFEGSLGFTFGRPRSACFLDRDGALDCDYGVIDGGAVQLSGGLRRILPGQGGFVPYLRAALGVRLVRFSEDDLSGLALPLSVGLGVRARAVERFWVGVDASGEAGVVFLNRGLGTQTQLGLGITAVAEFSFD